MKPLHDLWRAFVDGQPKLKDYPPDDLVKLERVWLDGAQSVLSFLEENVPNGPSDVQQMRAALTWCNDEVMGSITRIHNRRS